MASITIRNLDAHTKARLRVRAAHRQRSMVATRNVSDYEGCGIKVVNPWDVC